MKKKATLLLVVCSIAATLTSCKKDKETPPDLRAIGLQKILTEAKAYSKAPAIVLSVARPSRNWSWESAVGEANITTKEAATVAHKFRAASVTKMFTAASVMLLVQENKLKLSDKISQHLSASMMKQITDKVPQAAEITIQHLLNHTSSFAEYTGTAAFSNYVFTDPPAQTTPEAAIAIGLAISPVGTVGTFKYSNVNYNLLGLIIEKVSATPYRTFVSERIFKPLQMASSYFPADEKMTAPFLSQYFPTPANPEVLIDITSFMNVNWAQATGDLITTTSDLQKFLQALVKGRIVSPQSFTTMRNANVPSNIFKLPDEKYGLGLLSSPTPVNFVGHHGDFYGVYSKAYYIQNLDLYVVCAFNGEDDKGFELIVKVIEFVEQNDK